MREDDVAARLRSVLAATPGGVHDQAAAAGLRRSRPGVPSRYASGLGGLSATGDPLSWSDIIPAWPDDVDLDPLPDPPETPPVPAATGEDSPASGIPPDVAAAGAHVVASGVVALPPLPADALSPDETGGFRAGTPWASPPGALDSDSDPFPSHLGDLMNEAEPFRAQRAPTIRPAAVPDRRPLPPPAWVLPEEEQARDPAWPPPAGPDNLYAPSGGWPDPETETEDPLAGPGLSAAGAFGGGPPETGRRFGLGAFDPGRRGVRALAAVAVLVIVIAAVLAWRARPRVDTVAPPAFDATGSTGEPPRRVAASSAVSELVVAVGGKVRKPGLVRLPAGSRVADALTAAGGADPGVDVAMLNLARKVVDGELIMVGVTPPPGAVATGPPGTGAATPAGGPVNLNTATLADLDGLPGVGPVLAQRILEARDAQGGFTAVSDLRKVDGIGDARYEQLKDLVTV